MKIALCGSLNFSKEIVEIKDMLEAKGHEILLPQSIIDYSLKDSAAAEKLKESRGEYLKKKSFYTKLHFKKIEESDAILVVNGEKHGIKNYIGGATLGEILIAFYYSKKIFLWNPVPTDERLKSLSDEIEATQPVILNGNLEMVK